MSRWFLRLTCAAVLSVAFAGLLTWAGWPRPRFVVRVPDLTTVGIESVRGLRLEGRLRSANDAADWRSPWVGFVLKSRRPQPPDLALPPQRDFWFVNGNDGRTAGPWHASKVASYGWDCRGAAVFSTDGDPPTIARFDPETETVTPISTERAADFLLSDNGETLLTFAVPPPGQPTDIGELNYVCFDLAADPATRTVIEVPLPGGGPVRAGSVGISPDGRRVALADLWADEATVRVPGVRLFDARTGKLTATLTDYGPPAKPGPPDGAFGLVFSPDSRFLRLHRRPWPARPSPDVHRPFDTTEDETTRRVIDLATGHYVPPPHPAYTPGLRREFDRPSPEELRSPDGSTRLDVAKFERPLRFRVVKDGMTQSPWRTLPPARDIDLFIGGNTRFVPATTGLAWTGYDPSPEWRWAEWLRKRRGLPRNPATELLWYDWAADEFRAVERYSSATPPKGHWTEVAAQPNRILVFRRSPHDGPDATIEVWDAPPPRRPWAWSVPAGVALGVTVTALGTRLRRRKQLGKS